MPGKKGMLHYSKEMKQQIREEYESSASVNALIQRFGISRYSIQSWCGLRPEVTLRQQAPMPRGRKPANPRSLEQEAKRLRMENELLRDFLREYGRR